MTFEIIKSNYEKGLWTKQMVKIAVKKGVITREQYEEIVGESYE
jgi:uncharacterized XkdX family phage protein